MAQLTDRKIANFKSDKTEAWLNAAPNLWLRVRGVAKAWVYRYTVNGKVKKLAIGTYPEKSLAEAVAEALELRKTKDPAADKAARQATRMTVNDLFDRWLKTDLVRHKDMGAEVVRLFNKDVLPVVGAIYADELTRGHITTVVDNLLARGVERQAKICFGLMRQMLRYGQQRGIIDTDPSALIRKAAIGGKTKERDRALSEDEIRALSSKLKTAGLSEQSQAALWIAFSTCSRIGEVIQAQWADVDFDNAVWRIPAANSKNGLEHRVNLSDFTLEQFETLKALAAARLAEKQKTEPKTKPWPYVFPSKDLMKHLDVKTVTKQVGDRQRAEGAKLLTGRTKSGQSLVLAGGRWTPHDLRRTGATLMVSLGVAPVVVERCLNHVEQNRMARIYQRHSYEAEMRQAWKLLGDRLALLKADVSNIVLLQTA